MNILSMRMIDLDTLEIFRAVVQEGGVLRAAAKLHRVPSNVTTRIRQLEERLGVRLFQRQGRSLALSEEGRTLFGYAERLLRLADEAVDELSAGPPRGPFRLGSLESVSASRLPAVLSRFHQRHPQVRLELVCGHTAELVHRVNGFDLEAAFVSDPFRAEGLETVPVFEEELVLITPGSLPRLRRARELEHMTMIAFARGCSYRKRLEDWLGQGGVVPERVLEFASYQAMISCVAAGTGFAVVPRSVLLAQRASGGVVQHALPAKIARSRTCLIWRGRGSKALAGLLEVLKAKPPAGRGLTAAAPAR